MSDKKVIKDLPYFRKKMEKIDANRLTRIREAKESKSMLKLARLWAEHELKIKSLSDKQRMAIFLMTDFTHNYSYTYIAKRIGISINELMIWRNDPYFLQQLDKEISKRKNFIRLHAFRNVHRAILRGDMKATWNYLKMSGDLKENVEIVDKTGEHELSDDELKTEILSLQKQLAANTIKEADAEVLEN